MHVLYVFYHFVTATLHALPRRLRQSPLYHHGNSAIVMRFSRAILPRHSARLRGSSIDFHWKICVPRPNFDTGRYACHSKFYLPVTQT